MKINIDIKDERHFIDVVSIVDRDDFIKEVERIRFALGIKTPLSNNDFSKIPTKGESDRIDAEIEQSRKHLYLPIVFRSVIGAVVFRNEVVDEDYSPAYLDCRPDGTFDKEGATPDETYFIILSPGVRDEDVLKALQKYRGQLGNIKGAPKYQYIHQIWEVNKNKPSLRKYRDWYWTLEAGGTFADIAQEETSKCPIAGDKHKKDEKRPKECTCYDESTIRKGIDAYKALLWKTRTS